MKSKVIKVWIDEHAVYIQTEDGSVYQELFEDYPRLCHATQAQRSKFEYNNIGIHWDELNEDFSFSGFMNKKATAAD
jgi:hypothetical protein